MSETKKQSYVEPKLEKHDQIQEVTAGTVTIISGFDRVPK